MIVSTKELGAIINITPRHIYNLEKSKIIDKVDKDCWDLKKVIPAYIKYKLESGDSSNLAKSKEKRERYEAELKRLEYLKKIGQLIPIEQVAKELEDIAVVVSNKLYSLPSKLKSRYKISNAIEANLIQEIEDILRELKDPSVYEKQTEEIAQKLELEKELENESSDTDRANQNPNEK